jgi:inositol oxygenase
MIALTTSDGTSVIASEDGVIEVRRDKAKKSLWQTLLGSNGEIFLRSMHGKFLCVEETGNVLADRQLNSTWETFQVVPHSTSTSPSKLSSSHGSVFVGGGRGGIALKNFHGGYLGIDASSNKVVSSREPIPWDGDLKSLVCNKSDAKPLFIKIMRKYQTKAFVQKEQAKYGDFQHACMSIPDACNALLTLIADESPCHSWIFRYMLGTAEILREEGHPDWLQLSAFL